MREPTRPPRRSPSRRDGRTRASRAAGRRFTALVVGLATQAWPALSAGGTLRLPLDRPGVQGKLLDLQVTPRGLALRPGARRGTYESPVLTLARPFDRAVPYWNAQTPAGSRVEVWARLFRNGRPISRWMRVCAWSREGRGKRTATVGPVVLDQDTLKLGAGVTADAAQLRLVLAGRARPASRDVVVSLAGLSTFSSHDLPAPGTSRPAAALDLPVPFRSQRAADPSIASRICGPTSLAMALEYLGTRLSTEEVARLALDPDGPIQYGNWAYLAAVAAELGLESEVLSCSSMDEVVREIEAGHPVILSLSFRAGQLAGAPVGQTQGHLVLARGIDRQGRILVNDPAGRTARQGRVAYDRTELTRAWRGIAIVTRRRLTAVAAPY